MQNLLELENWMIEKNIKNIFLPNNKNNRFVTDIGEGLEDVYGLFIWYTNDEKGNRTDLKYFNSEKEAVQYVYEYLLKMKNKFNNWKLDKIENIHFKEFFDLIDNNRNRIIKTFPVTVSNCIDLKVTEEFIIKNLQIEKEKSGYYFYVRNIETNNLIGYIGIKKIDYSISKCELFYFIDKDFEGKGIISKSVSDVIEFCFNQLKMNKIFICTSKINFGSQQIALKNGFIQEGTLREEFKNHEGVLEDINYYGLLRSDYEK